MYRKTTFVVALTLLALQLSCGDPVGISSDIRTITPEATEINATVLGDNLHVRLRLVDPIVLADDERIPVLVRTTSSDLEQVMTRPIFCETSEQKYVCGTVVIGTGPEALGGLQRQLEQVDAVLLSTIFSGTQARAYFPYGAMEDILATVDRWPGVRWVEVAGVVPGGIPMPDVGPSAQMEFRGVMAITGSTAERFNRRVEAGEQDSLTVEYDGGPPGAPSLSRTISVR